MSIYSTKLLTTFSTLCYDYWSPILSVIRVLLIGPHGSGKTALRRAALRQPFTEVYKPGFLSKYETYMHINNTTVSVELWDATEEAWPVLSQLVVDVVVLCLDISNQKSIEYVEKTDVRISHMYQKDIIWDAIRASFLNKD